MRRLILASLLLCVAATASAADLSLAIPPDWTPRAQVGDNVSIRLRIHNNGPDTATGVRVVISTPLVDNRISRTDFVPCSSGVECALRDIAPSKDLEVSVSGKIPSQTGAFIFTATVFSANDPEPGNDTGTRPFEVHAEPDMELFFTQNAEPYKYSGDPEEKETIEVGIMNRGVTPATDVALTVDFPPGTKILSTTGNELFDCEAIGTSMICRAAVFPVTGYVTGIRVSARYLTPPLYDGGTVQIAAHVRQNEPDFDPRDNDITQTLFLDPFFAVTNTNDDGPGSLRQAILDANALCTKTCTVGFRIPGPLPPNGWFTIQPRTPLPVINFNGAIKGTSEEKLLDLAPGKPIVMLDGSLLKSGDGLTLISDTKVSALAIGNFPRFGLYREIQPSSKSRYGSSGDRLYLGVDPTGRVAAPNERGLGSTLSMRITNSVISGNRRSGMAVYGHVYVDHCRIGVAADSDAAIPNGASGIFVLLPSSNAPVYDVETTIRGCVIAHHPDFGIALHMPTQRAMLFENNSIYDNFAGAIDYGLDGPTPNVFDDSLRQPNKPTIVSAIFDGKRTTITVRVETRERPTLFPENENDHSSPHGSGSRATIEVYATPSPKRDATVRLGIVTFQYLERDKLNVLTGSLTVDGDLRGDWITGVAIRTRSENWWDYFRYSYETSEVSEAVGVK
ncbi:MAG TPA: hypothetical protein VJZ00_08560 [Thermoanaerobaculia bacterium]|nr:hypothetical protein [Thermoanaerobaculia bacterium]